MRSSSTRLAESVASRIRLTARKAIAGHENVATNTTTANTSIPVIPTCPAPTCVCGEMPANLDIERSKPLNGTMARYATHVLISSGQADWTSKIEDERHVRGWGQFTADLKGALGPRGRFHDPYNNILISISSFHTSGDDPVEKGSLGQDTANLMVFPAFKRLSSLPTEPSSLDDFVKAYILREKETYEGVEERTEKSERLVSQTHVSKPTILICSHASRDQRCGILGPLLRDEFASYLTRRGVNVDLNGTFGAGDQQGGSTTEVEGDISQNTLPASELSVSIGLISHVGGHKWAGNVILYIPPDWNPSGRDLSPLAGMGIWYGRVEPKNVQGIVEETLYKGKVIKDLFRGGISQGGTILSL